MSFQQNTRLIFKPGGPQATWCDGRGSIGKWQEEFSKSKSVCGICISFFDKKKNKTRLDVLQHQEHMRKQKKSIEAIKPRKTIIKIQTSEKIKLAQYLKEINEDTKILKKKEITKPILTPKEELKMKGQYCTYHHSNYDKNICVCKRDREGLLKWYDSYNRQKQCVKCDSLECDCPRTKEGNIIKKIIVKEVYEYGKYITEKNAIVLIR